MPLRLFLTGRPQHQKRPGRGRRGYYDRSAQPKKAVREAVQGQLPEDFEKLTGRLALGAKFYFGRPAAHYTKGKDRKVAVERVVGYTVVRE